MPPIACSGRSVVGSVERLDREKKWLEEKTKKQYPSKSEVQRFGAPPLLSSAQFEYPHYAM